MIKQFLIRVLILVAVIVGGITAPQAAPVPIFTTEQEAQQSCPADTVVWVNLKTGVYHFRGQRWYGNTASGAYICRKQADAVGYRPTRNGQ